MTSKEEYTHPPQRKETIEEALKRIEDLVQSELSFQKDFGTFNDIKDSEEDLFAFECIKEYIDRLETALKQTRTARQLVFDKSVEFFKEKK